MRTQNCGCNKACGCGDLVLTTPPSCPAVCTNGDPCPETFEAKCVVYMGDTIANLNITQGMRLDTIIQLLASAVVNPGCIFPTAPCQSAIGFYSTAIGSGTMSFKWLAVAAATGYQVEYRPVTSPTWIQNPVTTNLVDSIGGLSANTAYYIRVRTICGVNSCNSLVLLITTTP